MVVPRCLSNLCRPINFMFEGCFGVVLGNPTVGESLADLTHGFGDG